MEEKKQGKKILLTALRGNRKDIKDYMKLTFLFLLPVQVTFILAYRPEV